MPTQQRTLHVVTHTHWDREWYSPFQVYRLRLYDLMKHLLEIFDTDPEFRYFTLDGQTVVLEDYLEIVPDDEPRLRDLVKKGRLLVGPWYILPDEFLVSGEATIRNLLVGRRIARDFGRVMKIGYLPDMFGHISQMPQILRGFGMDNALIWRGFGGNGQNRAEWTWQGPDGSRVLMHHIPPGGYCTLINIPDDIDEATKRFRDTEETLAKRTTTGQILIFNGVDHLEPQLSLTHIMREVNKRLEGSRIVHSTYEKFVDALRRRIRGLPTVQGEFREGFNHTCILVDVSSSRVELKLENRKTQTLLERYAEPLHALHRLCGGEDYSPALRQAWKYLLQNHPHDSICGCSGDETHKDMGPRFKWAQEIGQDLVTRAFRTIAVSMPPLSLKDGECELLVFNPLPCTRRLPITAEIEVSAEQDLGGIKITDEKGKTIPHEVRRSPTPFFQLYGKFRDNPSGKPVLRHTVQFDSGDVPGVGFRRLVVRPRSGAKTTPGRRRDVEPGQNAVLENEFLRLEIQPSGVLSITDKRTGNVYRDLNALEDVADAGDEYNFGPLKDEPIRSHAATGSISVHHTCFGVTAYVQVNDWRLPAGLARDRKSRRTKMVRQPLWFEISLPEKGTFVDVSATVINRAGNHRLRVVFPTDLPTDTYVGDSKFDVIERAIGVPPYKEGYAEVPTSTRVHDSWVGLSDGRRGLAVITQGLLEHAVYPDDRRTLAVTLIRATGHLSRADGANRPYNAGTPDRTPDAQCFRTYGFHYRICPHAGTWEEAEMPRLALDLNVSMPIFQINAALRTQWAAFPHHDGRWTPGTALIRVEPPALLATAIKWAEEGDGVIVRCYNVGRKTVQGRFLFAETPKSVHLSTIAEKPIRKLATSASSRTVSLPVKPKQIITLRIRWDHR